MKGVCNALVSDVSQYCVPCKGNPSGSWAGVTESACVRTQPHAFLQIQFSQSIMNDLWAEHGPVARSQTVWLTQLSDCVQLDKLPVKRYTN